MAVNLSRYVDELRADITDPALLKIGAEAMADEMRKSLALYIGGDLRMSRFPGAPPTFTTSSSKGEATLELGGGTYALADKGRRQAKRARARRGSALRTPWGPRRSVRGSRWPGFSVTERHAAGALEAGVDAITAAVSKAAG